MTRSLQPPDAIDLCPPAPAPRERPFGLFGLMGALWRNPLEAWTRTHFEEPIVQTSVPFGKAVVVSDPPAIRHILLENTGNYQKDSLQRRILGATLRDGLLTAEGERWREQRRVLAQIFSRRRVTSFAPAILDAVRAASDRWRAAPNGRNIDVAQEMGRFTLDVLVRTIFSDGFGEAPDVIQASMQRFFESIGRIDPLDVIGAPDFLPRLTRLSAWSAGRVFDRAVDAIVKRRMSDRRDRVRREQPDLLDLLLDARDPETGRGLSELEVRANIVTFIAAGHETTSNALTWSIYLLSLSREWRDRVVAEAAGAANAPPAELEGKLPVTRAVIDESMRLYPPLVAISRQAKGPDVLGGVTIDPGTFVIIAPYVLHRHRRIWRQPNAFDPTRFLGENAKMIDKCAYLPFGFGPRVCIGAAFAQQEATIALACFMRDFDFELPRDASVHPRHRVTLKPGGGLPMAISARAAPGQAEPIRPY